MNWQEKLRQLEQLQEWDYAIEFMEQVIINIELFQKKIITYR